MSLPVPVHNLFTEENERISSFDDSYLLHFSFSNPQVIEELALWVREMRLVWLLHLFLLDCASELQSLGKTYLKKFISLGCSLKILAE